MYLEKMEKQAKHAYRVFKPPNFSSVLFEEFDIIFVGLNLYDETNVRLFSCNKLLVESYLIKFEPIGGDLTVTGQ